MNLANRHRHSFRNRLQSLLLIGFMAGFLALLGHLIWGPEGMLQLLFFGVILAFLHPVASPWLVLRLYRARPLRPAEAPQLYAAVTELARRAEHRPGAQIRHSGYCHYRGCEDLRVGGGAAGPGDWLVGRPANLDPMEQTHAQQSSFMTEGKNHHEP